MASALSREVVRRAPDWRRGALAVPSSSALYIGKVFISGKARPDLACEEHVPGLAGQAAQREIKPDLFFGRSGQLHVLPLGRALMHARV